MVRSLGMKHLYLTPEPDTMQYLAFLTVGAAKLKYSSSKKNIERKEHTT
jgi:hypothetical protein